MKIRNLIFLLLASVLGGFIAVFAYTRLSDSKEYVLDGTSPNHFQLASFNAHNILDVSYPDLTFAAEKAVHCVVHVKVKSVQLEYGNIWEYLYGRPTQQVPTEGFGSGVIISADGYIVTNNHVIRSSEEIEVVLNDNRAFTAKIIGTDTSTDLALLKIEENNLPYLTFGDSEASRVGEWVLAVGNPYNLMSTVTAGIISAKGRQVSTIGSQPRQRQRQQQQQQSPQQQMSVESYIQTDAAVNPGNSGGALVNIRGELIGINTALYSGTGEFTGNAFAIPATIVQKVIGDLKEFGVVQRALLGVGLQPIDDKLAKEKDLKFEGVYVAEVHENGGAYAAGIKASDVITSVNGVFVNSVPELQEQISKYRPNDQVDVTVIRDKKTQHFKVTLRNIEDTTQILRGDNANTVFGAIFEEITNRDRQSLRIRSGVKVKDVGEGKLKDLGIRNGYIITAVNDKPVNSAKDIQVIFNAVAAKNKILISGVYPNGQVAYYGFDKEPDK